jgi:phage nucleotide-binding protein
MEIKSTKNLDQHGVNILVYGHSGVGKTKLIETLPKPFIISAEGGLLSLEGDFDFVEVHSMEEIKEAYQYLRNSNEYESVVIDSLTEIADVVLNHEKMKNKDGRMAYSTMAEQMSKIIRAFIHMSSLNIYMTAQCEKQQDETGRILQSPSTPGTKFAQKVPYFFDEVLALRGERNDEGKITRALMCDGDGSWLAKDRSGKLNAWEKPDLGAIINKIKGVE